MVDSTLSHYRLIEKLGEGGMGVVYRAHDEQLDRDVAIKVLPASSFQDEQARARLLREARSAAALNHPNICTIYEVGEADGQAYIAMELVHGQPLSEKLAGGPLPAPDVLRYGSQLADGLAHAHQNSLVHRDLKSANVIVTPEGRVKILDFGLAKRVAGEELSEATTASGVSLTRPDTVVGTLAYMAPEQLRGQPADERSDIWALGVVLHEMAAGARPFQGKTGFELSSAILKEPALPLPANTRPDLKAVIEHCLEKEPQRRYQQAGELRAALETLRSGTLTVPFPSRPFPRRWILTAAGLVALTILAVLFGLNAGGLREQVLGWTGARPIQSLAVLPLENLSHDPDQDWLVEGMHAELITELATVGGFKKVIARPSVLVYRNTNQPLPPLREIARKLGVEAILTGSVLRSGDRVLLTVQLTKAATEETLWAEKYEREFRDVLTVQSEIVGAIARGIKLQLTPQQQARLTSARPINPEAQEAYLKGMFYLNKFTPEGFQKGLSYLHQAIEKEPGSALLYAKLALAYSFIGHTPTSPPDALPNSKAAALKALELDPTQAEAYEALAEVKLYFDRDWDWAGIERAFRRALELNPSMPDAHAHYCYYLLLFGRRDEALAEMKRSAELDPLEAYWSTWLAETYTLVGQYQQAVDQARKLLEFSPDFPPGLWALGNAYAAKGMYQEAITALQKANAISPDWGWTLGTAYSLAGHPGEARKILAELEKGKGVWNTFGIAEIHTALGEKDQAFRWLETAYERRHPWIPWIGVWNTFAPLRDDPRLHDLLRRMHLTAGASSTMESKQR